MRFVSLCISISCWWSHWLSYRCSNCCSGASNVEAQLRRRRALNTVDKKIITTIIGSSAENGQVELIGNAVRVKKNHSAFHDTLRECSILLTCDLTSHEWGVPTVLISAGRSGSLALWWNLDGLLRNTTDSRKPVQEDAGSNSGDLTKFMERHESEGKCWLVHLLCEKQQQNKERDKAKQNAIFGTKWKPYFPAFNMTAARDAFVWLAAAPYVKVIYNQRNPLDVVISRAKHHAVEASGSLIKAHCQNEDLECIKQHNELASKAVINIDTLHEDLQELAVERNMTLQLLQEYNLIFLPVTYEELFYGKTANQWQQMVDFLGLAGPQTNNITREDVNRVAILASTSDHQDRSNSIANYEAVVEALTGTIFEEYLKS